MLNQPLVTIGVDGADLATIWGQGAFEVSEYALTPESERVIFIEECGFSIGCRGSALFSVDIDGGDRIQMNSASQVVGQFKIRP